MAAPILMECDVPQANPAPSPEERAGLLASLWLGHDEGTVVVSLEVFVQGVARQIAEAEERVASPQPKAVSAESPVRLRPVPRTGLRPS
jgi:hypothetical protein